MALYPIVRIKNTYGEFLTTTDILDRAIAKFLPASLSNMRGAMQRAVPAADDYAEVESVSEFLIMLAATAPDLTAWDAPAPEWMRVRFGEDGR